MFSPEIARDYVVAVYPSATPFDVETPDFALRVGQRVAHADRPMDVIPWPEKRNPAGRLPVDVTAETGVVYSRTSDPVNGTRQGIGTYSGVDVSSRPGDIPPAPPPGPDPRILDERFAASRCPRESPRPPSRATSIFRSTE